MVGQPAVSGGKIRKFFGRLLSTLMLIFFSLFALYLYFTWGWNGVAAGAAGVLFFIALGAIWNT